MKIRYQILIGILLMMVCLISGCSDEDFLFVSSGTGGSSSCPNNAWCEEHIFTNSTIYVDYLLTNDTVRIELA